MADIAAAAQASGSAAAPFAPATAPSPGAGRGGAARAARREAAIARAQSVQAGASAAAAPAEIAKPAPAQEVTAPKPAEVADKPDPATERGLRAIEQQKKRWLDEQQAKETDYQVRIAKLAEREKQAEGKLSSRDELKKLSPTELLDMLDHFGEDDHDILSRAAYARTKAGKTDPRAQAAAQEAARGANGRAAATKLEEKYAALEARYAELEAKFTGEFTRRDQASFAERWVGEAVKAIPADKPSFLSKLFANEPDTARRELLTIGAELEKANDGQPPEHAEVVAEFEKRERARLKAMGLDADALLAPAKPAAPANKPVTRTLDVTAANVTRPENAPKTREERRALAIANFRARQRATADAT